jgi:hypothetical protein
VDAHARPLPQARPRRRSLPDLLPVAVDLLGAMLATAAIALIDGGSLAPAAVLAPAVYLAINWVAGLYRLSGRQETHVSNRVVLTLLLTTALFAGSAALLERSTGGGVALLPGAAIWLGVFGSSLLSRVGGDRLRRNLSPERWLVVGDARAAWRLRGALSAKDPVHVVAAEPLPVNGFAGLDSRSEAMETLRRFDVDRVVLAPPEADSRTALGLIRTFKSLGVKISVLSPSLEMLEDLRYETRVAGGIPMVDIGPLAVNGNGNGQPGPEAADHLVPRRNGNGTPPRISVVLPTLNEEENLPHVFNRLPEDLHEVILVDGGSTDDTVRVAREHWPGIRVLIQPGQGKGDALRTGFAAVTGDIIVMLDADGSTDPAEIPRFVEQLDAGADFAKGSRFVGDGGSDDITPMRRMGNRALSTTVNVLYGTGYSDLCYGYNAFWTHCLPYIALDVPGFEVETLMNVRIAKAGLKVSEVPSFEARRLHGQSKLSTFRDGYRVLRTILRERPPAR